MSPGLIPIPATLGRISFEDRENHLFELVPTEPLEVGPGQFVELTVPGSGEFPVSTAGTTATGFAACIRQSGRVSAALFQLDEGATVGLRGPFGNGFDLNSFSGRDVLLVAGGLGIAPLRGLLHALLQQRERYGRIVLLYGARQPENILFRHEFEALAAAGTMELRFSVDFAPKLGEGDSYICSIGLVTELLKGLQLAVQTTTAAVCGPPSLYGCVLEQLASTGIDPDRTFATLERRMKCGTGQCCHCVCAGVTICRDGPVFSLTELRTMPGAI